MDTPFTEQRLSAVEVSLEGDETVAILIDLDRLADADRPAAGQITIRFKAP